MIGLCKKFAEYLIESQPCYIVWDRLKMQWHIILAFVRTVCVHVSYVPFICVCVHVSPAHTQQYKCIELSLIKILS